MAEGAPGPVPVEEDKAVPLTEEQKENARKELSLLEMQKARQE